VYSILYVHTARKGERPATRQRAVALTPRTPRSRPATDLTARARILDAAVELFAEQGEQGFSVRAIAARAGVSAALITHHFGTKDALKAECDERVLSRYTDLKMASMTDLSGSLGLLRSADTAAGRMVAYFLRTVLAGGPVARRFYDRLLAETRDIMASGIARGLVRPECADDAYLRHLTAANLGGVLVGFLVDPAGDITGGYGPAGPDLAQLEAQVDVLTHGVFSDETVLTTVRAARATGTTPAPPAVGGADPTTKKEDHV